MPTEKHIILTQELITKVIETYNMPQTIRATARLYNITERAVCKILKENNIEKHPAEVTNKLSQQAKEAGCLKKYGVKNPFAAAEIKEKIKETNLERYGAEYATQAEEIKQKTKDTCIKKYNATCPFTAKEVQQKIAETNLERYGAANPFGSNIIQEKIKQTNLEKYGVENPFQSDEIKDKIKNTFITRYNVEHALQMPESQEKFKNTCLERFGFENPSQNMEIKEKKKQTLFDNFGIFHSPCSHYLFNDERFDSFPELCFYLYFYESNKIIYREPLELTFILNDKQYKYYPDFMIDGKLYELKGDHLVNEDGAWQCPFDHELDELFEAKHQCALKNSVEILYYKDYKKYLDWFFESGYKKEDFIV